MSAAYFQFQPGYDFTATTSVIGNTTPLTTAVSVAKTQLAIPPEVGYAWYSAVFAEVTFGPRQLNVYKDDEIVLTAEVVFDDASSSVATDTDVFDRVYVDHLFHGESRVWWRFGAEFKDPGPYVYRLQASYVGHVNALDWVDVSLPGYNVSSLGYVNVREQTGKSMLTHVRVVLSTPRARYVSNGQPIWGNLSQRNFLLAKEVTRKEKLRLKSDGTRGYLIRRMRYGVEDSNVLVPIVGEIFDPTKRATYGTAFQIGYHPPIPLQVDLTYGPLQETRGQGDIQTNDANPRQAMARMLAQPDCVLEDVWVNADTDDRYLISEANIVVSLAGVPIVKQATLSLMPRNHIVYKIPVSILSFDTETDFSAADHSQVGDGCVAVNHNYTTEDELAYRDSACCGIAGATVRIFETDDYAAGRTDEYAAVASTVTMFGGQWGHTINLNPGNYTVVFEKPGLYGPDAVPIVVALPDAPVLPPVVITFDKHFEF